MKRPRACGFGALALAVSLLLGAPIGAAEDAAEEDILSGFDDPVEPADSADEAAAAGESWLVEGSIGLESAYNLEHHDSSSGTGYGGLSQLRIRGELNVERTLFPGWKCRIELFAFGDAVYALRDRDDYTERVLNRYEWELDAGEAWLQGEVADDFDVSIGRQVVNWGRSETLRLLDVVNPLDNREPFVLDIDLLRRPVTLVKADYYRGDSRLTALVVPEVRYDLQPPFGSDFYPPPIPIPRSQPDHFGDEAEFGVELATRRGGFDASLVGGRFIQNDGTLALGSGGAPVIRLDPFWMLGAGILVPRGGFLLKGEAAWFHGLQATDETGRLDDSYEEAGLLAGVEYTGLAETVFALDSVYRRRVGIDDTLAALEGPDDEDWNATLRVTRDFLNDRLRVTVLGIVFGLVDDQDSLVRLSADYTLSDSWSLRAGVILFQNGDGPLGHFGDNDRVFLRVRWAF